MARQIKVEVVGDATQLGRTFADAGRSSEKLKVGIEKANLALKQSRFSADQAAKAHKDAAAKFGASSTQAAQAGLKASRAELAIKEAALRAADAQDKLTASSKRVAHGTDQARASAEKATARLRGFASSTTAKLAGFAAGGALVSGIKSSITAASDLGETMSKTQVVFGKSAGIVTRFGDTAAKSVGLSTQAALEAAATFGNLFVAMKIGQRPAASMSVGLVKLAGDLASFNNVDPSQVLEDLRSGLVGEVEPLRKYGIALNAASVEQEAMRETGKSNAKQLTEADKVTARYTLILQNTKTAQGDFARTSGGLANQQRILNAQWKDAQAQFGKALLPAMLEGVKVASRLAGGFASLDKSTGGLASKALVAAGGLAGIGVAVGKTIQFVSDSRKAWAALRAAKLADVAITPAVVAAEAATGTAAAASGTAAAGAATRFGALRAAFLGIGGASTGAAAAVAAIAGPVAIAVAALAGLALAQNKVEKAADHQADGVSRSVRAWHDNVVAMDRYSQLSAEGKKTFDEVDQTIRSSAEGQRAFAAAQAAALPGLVASGHAATDGADHFTRLGSAWRATATEARKTPVWSAALREELNKSRESILGVADAFEHGKRGSAVSAKSIIGDLRNEVATLKTWASDAQTLLKRGMDPNAVKFLSDKGPEYLHAFATGSDKQVASFERLFKGRMHAATDAAVSTGDRSSEAFKRLKEKANAETARIKAAKARTDGRAAAAREFELFKTQANAAVGGIHGKTARVVISSSFQPPKGMSIHSIVGAHGGEVTPTAITPRRPVRRARGGDVWGAGTATSDSIPAYLSNGEFVVNAKSAGRHRQLLHAINSQHYATGGTVTIDGRGDLDGLPGAARATDRTLTRATEILARAFARKTAAALEKKFGGGPGIGRALSWARGQVGKPYIWGGVGPRGYDCSGFMSAITNVIMGRSPYHRLFATGSFPTSGWSAGMLRAGFNIGSRRGNPGHMAGTLGGVNVESRGSRGVVVGAGARGAGSALFGGNIWHLAGRSGANGGKETFPGFAAGGPVRLGSVSAAQWQALLAAGWRGRPGDRMEALYPPARRRAPVMDAHRAAMERWHWARARRVSVMSDAAREQWVGRYGLPPAPPGFGWAEDLTLDRRMERYRGRPQAYRAFAPHVYDARHKYFGRTGFATGGPVSGAMFDRGGWLMPGLTMAVNNTGRPERVVGPREQPAAGIAVTVNINGPVIGDARKFANELTPHLENAIRQSQRRRGVRPAAQLA